MSKVSNIIFNDSNGSKHYITSPYGRRKVMSTSGGKTSSFHNGTDYGTNSKKIPQYAIEDGYCFASAKSSSDGAHYVWIIYPRIKRAMLHYHLDSRSISAGKSVKKGTLLGYTGKSGKSTGIHLHLGVRNLTSLSTYRINNMTWDALRSCSYEDPEAYARTYTAKGEKTKTGNPYQRPTYVLNRKKYEYGKIKVGNPGVKWLQWELQRLGFYTGKIDGFFGPGTETSVKNFQRAKGLEVDGQAYTKTFNALESAK